jgi:hypothetical protein
MYLTKCIQIVYMEKSIQIVSIVQLSWEWLFGTSHGKNPLKNAKIAVLGFGKVLGLGTRGLSQ